MATKSKNLNQLEECSPNRALQLKIKYFAEEINCYVKNYILYGFIFLKNNVEIIAFHIFVLCQENF